MHWQADKLGSVLNKDYSRLLFIVLAHRALAVLGVMGSLFISVNAMLIDKSILGTIASNILGVSFGIYLNAYLPTKNSKLLLEIATRHGTIKDLDGLKTEVAQAVR